MLYCRNFKSKSLWERSQDFPNQFGPKDLKINNIIEFNVELKEGLIIFHLNVFKLSSQHSKFRQLHNGSVLMTYC